jgi:hypothetical protein
MGLRIIVLVTAIGCSHPDLHGSGLLVNVQPNAPSFSASYDFDLLEPVVGKGCANRYGVEKAYWMAIAGLDKTSRDATTNRAIGAAAFAAIKDLADADTILLTKLVTEESQARVCTTVYGRAVRVRKAGVGAKPAEDASVEDGILDRDAIASTVRSVMSEIVQCATFEHGPVKLSVTVAPDGRVTSATVKSAPSEELGRCVAKELSKVVFPPTRFGGSFTYPFSL